MLPLSHTANAVGNADTRYSGNRPITTDSYSGGFRLRELRNNVRIETYNSRNGTDYSSAVDFNDDDNIWSASEFNNTNKDNAALDAHWAAEQVYEYWKQIHGRNSIDNLGLPILNYVHYSNCSDVSNAENAGWDRFAKVMNYGDGCIRFSPLVSIDVVGHELGHGICQATANLNYQGESGALNEGFSDIWGACIENWATTNKQTWQIGEEITLLQNALRSMSNPKTYGQPDTYHGTNWVDVNSSSDFGGVHTNSGVLNHWFYLLSVGGNGTNDLNNAFCVSGIGINSAARIAYAAERDHLTATSQYSDARTYTIQAASDIFGPNSNEVVQTTNAWYAVGVGTKANYVISGPSIICSTGLFSITYLPAGSIVTWASSNTSGLTIDQNGHATRVGSFNGIVNITASVSGSCGSFTVPFYSVPVGSPVPGSISGYFDSTLGKVSANSIGSPSAFKYNWYINDVLARSGTDPSMPPSPSGRRGCGTYYFDVSVEAVNVCGTSPKAYKRFYAPPCGGSSILLTVYPNPANSDITVIKQESKMANDSTTSLNLINNDLSETSINTSIQDEITLFHRYNQIMCHGKLIHGKITFLTSKFPDGFYYLKIDDGKKPVVKQVLIQH